MEKGADMMPQGLSNGYYHYVQSTIFWWHFYALRQTHATKFVYRTLALVTLLIISVDYVPESDWTNSPNHFIPWRTVITCLLWHPTCWILRKQAIVVTAHYRYFDVSALGKIDFNKITWLTNILNLKRGIHIKCKSPCGDQILIPNGLSVSWEYVKLKLQHVTYLSILA